MIVVVVDSNDGVVEVTTPSRLGCFGGLGVGISVPKRPFQSEQRQSLALAQTRTFQLNTMCK